MPKVRSSTTHIPRLDDLTLAQFLAEHGPDAMLDALADALRPAEPPRATDWWPEPVDRDEVDRLRAGISALTEQERIEGAGAMAVALVEVLAEIVADTAGPRWYAPALLNLIPAMKQEVLVAMQTGDKQPN